MKDGDIVSAAPALAPVAPEKRLATLDILRGLAMFGVLFSNLYVWYGTPRAVTASDHMVSWIDEWMVDSRFYTLLGFLFGMGFAIQLDRAGDRSSDARRVFARRMLVLLGFGIVHGMFIWRGDILTEYALLGFVLMWFGRWAQRNLAMAAAACYFLGPYVVVRTLLALGVRAGGPTGYPLATKAAYMGGTYAQVVTARIPDYFFVYRRLLTEPGVLSFLALFLLGMLVTRSGILAALANGSGQARRWLLWSLAAALLGIAVGAYWQKHFPEWWPARSASLQSWRGLTRWRLLTMGEDLVVWSEAAAYACLVALVAMRDAGARMLMPLAAAGRMPLTTYLVQSMVCTNLFYGYGLIGWGKWRGAAVMNFSLALFAVQMAFSVYWLRHFRFGPAEWAWRSAAYGRAQSIWKGAGAGT